MLVTTQKSCKLGTSQCRDKRLSYRTRVKARALDRVDQYSKETTLVCPAILAADFARLGDEVRSVEEAGAEWLHFDVVDGRYARNITMGAGMVEALRPHTQMVLHCHLAVVEPELMVQDFVKAGADVISVHCEHSSTTHLHRTLNQIKELGCKAGVAINPGTPVSAMEYVLDLVDMVQVMTVSPGFGGQKFIQRQVNKVAEVKQLCKEMGVNPWIQADGGITPDNAWQVIEAGANVIVSGTAIFTSSSYKYAIEGVRHSKRPTSTVQQATDTLPPKMVLPSTTLGPMTHFGAPYKKRLLCAGYHQPS